MLKTGRLESRIKKIERFWISILHGTGRDVRSDKIISSTYTYERAADENKTVAYWIKNRFNKLYPGLGVTVLLASGHPADGRMKLKSDSCHIRRLVHR